MTCEQSSSLSWDWVLGREHFVRVISAINRQRTKVFHRLECRTCGGVLEMSTGADDAPIAVMEATWHIYQREELTAG